MRPSAPGTDLDAAWKVALHYAAVHQLAWGREITFTSGPLGFLYTGTFWPGTYPFVLAYWAFLAGVVVLTIISLGRARGWSVGATACFITLYGLLIAPPFVYDAMLLGIVVLVALRFLAVETESDSAYCLLAGMTFAALTLTKATFLFIVPTVLVLCVGKRLLAQRPAPAGVLVGGFVVSLLALWALAGQALGDLPTFARLALEVAAGYGDAMSLDGPSVETRLYLAGAAALLVTLALAMRDRGSRRNWLDLGTVALLLFAAFKHGFVRHDGHAVIAARVLLATVVLVAVVRPGALWPARIGYLVAGATALACVVVTAEHYGGAREAAVLQVRHLLANTRLIADPVRTLAEHRAGFTRIQRVVTAMVDLSDLDGPVDIVSHFEPLLLHGGLTWRPRPVFQSYVAYTPGLLRLNAESYRAPEAPRYVLLNVETIDNRFPALDDSLLWPILLTRYDVTEVRSPYLLLRRSPHPRDYALRPLSEGNARLDQPIPVPETGTGLLWATLDVQATRLGRLVSAAYKPPMLSLEAMTAGGARPTYRLVQGMARAGFLLSPLVRDSWEFGKLAAGNRADLAPWRVHSIVVRAPDGPVLRYRERVRYRFWELAFPPQPVNEATLWRWAFPGTSQAPWSSQAPISFRPVAGPEGGTVTLAHAPSRLVFRPARRIGHIEIEFGILDGAWQSGRTDGVEFRVSVEHGTSSTVLWSRVTDPRARADDRGMLAATIPVPEPLRGAPLVLETLPGPSGNMDGDWAFWSAVRFIE